MSPKRKIFAPHRFAGPPRAAIFLLCTALLLIAACTPDAADWSPHPASKKNEVRWIAFEHVARFSRDSDMLTPDETMRLQRFLAAHDAGRQDTVRIGAAGSRIGDTAARRREASVIAVLRDRDMTPALLPRNETTNGDGDVRVVLGRYIVIPPACPDWSKPAHKDPANTPSSNFGCATETNLGLMVADPGDLVRGRRPGPADGAAGARRYKTWREGEQAQTPAITPLIIQSGVGGAGQ